MYGTPVLMRLATSNTTENSYQLLHMSHCWRYSTCFQVFYSLAALAFGSNSFHIKSFTQIIMIWTLFWALGLTHELSGWNINTSNSPVQQISFTAAKWRIPWHMSKMAVRFVISGLCQCHSFGENLSKGQSWHFCSGTWSVKCLCSSRLMHAWISRRTYLLAMFTV